MNKLSVKNRKVDQLIPYARNSRTHDDGQVAQIAASIHEFGFTNPVLIDKEGGIIAGHGRVLAARKLGMEEVPTICLGHLTETQRRAYVIADNKIALNASWDEEMLRVEFDALKADGFDLSLVGFSGDELAELFAPPADDEPAAGADGQDDAPSLQAAAISKPGDVWVMGRHRVMCGDSTSVDSVERLMSGGKADFCFTSPPYNSAMKGGGRLGANEGKGFYADGYGDDRGSEEYVDFNRQIFAAMHVIAGERFTCCYNINYNKNSPSEYLDVALAGREYFPLVETIGWEKTMAISLQGDNLTRIFEFIFVYAKGGLKMNKDQTDCERNLWKVNNVGANHDIHKACFPVELVERGVSLFAPMGGVVFEPFGGSGTTAIACEKLGRTARLMELDPRYCDVIVRRWQQFTGQAATLEGDGRTFDQVGAAA